MPQYHITVVVISFVNDENTKLLFTVIVCWVRGLVPCKNLYFCWLCLHQNFAMWLWLVSNLGTQELLLSLPAAVFLMPYYHTWLGLRTVMQSFPCEVASLRVVILQFFMECCPNWSFILSSVPQLLPVFFICSISGYQVNWEKSMWRTGVGKQCVIELSNQGWVTSLFKWILLKYPRIFNLFQESGFYK